MTQLKLIAVLPSFAPPPILIEICDGVFAGAAANVVIGVTSPETARSTTKIAKNSFDIDFFPLPTFLISSLLTH